MPFTSLISDERKLALIAGDALPEGRDELAFVLRNEVDSYLSRLGPAHVTDAILALTAALP